VHDDAADGRSESLPLVAVYADESCLGNGRAGNTPGGAGGVIESRHPTSGVIVRRDYWVSEPDTTNNRMALRSVSEAVRALSKKGRPLRIVFISDSRYLVDGCAIGSFRGRHAAGRGRAARSRTWPSGTIHSAHCTKSNINMIGAGSAATPGTLRTNTPTCSRPEPPLSKTRQQDWWRRGSRSGSALRNSPRDSTVSRRRVLLRPPGHRPDPRRPHSSAPTRRSRPGRHSHNIRMRTIQTSAPMPAPGRGEACRRHLTQPGPQRRSASDTEARPYR